MSKARDDAERWWANLADSLDGVTSKRLGVELTGYIRDAVRAEISAALVERDADAASKTSAVAAADSHKEGEHVRERGQSHAPARDNAGSESANHCASAGAGGLSERVGIPRSSEGAGSVTTSRPAEAPKGGAPTSEGPARSLPPSAGSGEPGTVPSYDAYVAGVHLRGATEALDLVERPGPVPVGAPGSVQRRAWEIGKLLERQRDEAWRNEWAVRVGALKDARDVVLRARVSSGDRVIESNWNVALENAAACLLKMIGAAQREGEIHGDE